MEESILKNLNPLYFWMLLLCYFNIIGLHGGEYFAEILSVFLLAFAVAVVNLYLRFG